MDGDVTMADIRNSYNSPMRILLPKILKSRDGWKAKSHKRKAELKAAKIKIRDCSASRDMWRRRTELSEAKNRELQERAEQAESDFQAVQTQLADLQAQLADLKKK
jgi:chromosome segregation ATPase